MIVLPRMGKALFLWLGTLALILSGCATSGVTAAGGVQHSRAESYVGLGRGGCVGLTLQGGVVQKGFMAIGGGDLSWTWPIHVQQQVDDEYYIVQSAIGVPGKFLTVQFRLWVTDVSQASLSYKLVQVGCEDGILYTGRAVNVDEMGRWLEDKWGWPLPEDVEAGALLPR
jgi:hypothetical protein